MDLPRRVPGAPLGPAVLWGPGCRSRDLTSLRRQTPDHITGGLLEEARVTHWLFEDRSSELPERGRARPHPTTQWKYSRATPTPDEKEIVLRSKSAISDLTYPSDFLDPGSRASSSQNPQLAVNTRCGALKSTDGIPWQSLVLGGPPRPQAPENPKTRASTSYDRRSLPGKLSQNSHGHESPATVEVDLRSGSPYGASIVPGAPLSRAVLSDVDAAAVGILPSPGRQTLDHKRSAEGGPGHTPTLRRSLFGVPGAGENDTLPVTMGIRKRHPDPRREKDSP